MTSSERSLMGFAKQTAYGSPVSDHNSFTYVLFSEGSSGPQNIVIPLDPEIGGGAMVRSVVKVGVSSSGQMRLIPRPNSMGLFLYGVTGSVTSTPNGFTAGVAEIPLTSQAQTNWREKIFQPETPTTLYVVGEAGLTGSVTIHGRDATGATVQETLTLNGANKVTGSQTFAYVSGVDVPAGAGKKVRIGYDGGYTLHEFKLPTDQFDAPFYTVRFAPGGMWGEQYQDCRVNLLSLEFNAADFMRGTAAFVGGLPRGGMDVSSWNASSKVDGGPQFLAPYGKLELPTGDLVTLMSGSFSAVANIPLDEQFIVGRFTPEGLDIVSRAYVLDMIVKVKSETLYRKMMYDAAGGADWAANIFREANFNFEFRSDVGQYFLKIEGNGQTGANANVAWSAQPVAVRAQRQVVMRVSGMFLADNNMPVKITLNNKTSSY
jgi:hypothetical protein